MVTPAWVLYNSDHHQDSFINPVTTQGVPRNIHDRDSLKYLTSHSQVSRCIVININTHIRDKNLKNSENLKFGVLFKISAAGVHIQKPVMHFTSISQTRR